MIRTETIKVIKLSCDNNDCYKTVNQCEDNDDYLWLKIINDDKIFCNYDCYISYLNEKPVEWIRQKDIIGEVK